MNIFSRSADDEQSFPRRTFDMSFTSNLTTDMGTLKTVLNQEVLPGDTWRITPEMAFYSLPLAFPIQTDIKITLDFFYVRNRTLWDNWQDYIQGNDINGDTFPIIEGTEEQRKAMFRVGGIADHLGIPVAFYGRYGNTKDFEVTRLTSTPIDPDSDVKNNGVVYSYISKPFYNDPVKDLIAAFNSGSTLSSQFTPVKYNYYLRLTDPDVFDIIRKTLTSEPNKQSCCSIQYTTLADGKYNLTYDKALDNPDYLSPFRTINDLIFANTADEGNYVQLRVTRQSVSGDAKGKVSPIKETHPNTICLFDDENQMICYMKCTGVNSSSHEFEYDKIVYSYKYRDYKKINNVNVALIVYISDPIVLANSNNLVVNTCGYCHRDISNVADYKSYIAYGFANDIHDIGTDEGAKFFKYKSGQIELSALPFRASELVYNTFYRDMRNNPLVINGRKVFNKWIRNNKGGLDSTVYTFYNKNWQKDCFTTALQSPTGFNFRSGNYNAPIVGLKSVDSSGTFTFTDGENEYKALTETKDGDKVTSFMIDPNTPQEIKMSMAQAMQQGILISDFRDVNAFTKWLEKRNRAGRTYKDFMHTMYGQNISFNEVGMPEYLGGITRHINTNTVVNQSAGPNNAELGSLGGNLGCFGQGETIQKTCDEHGFIIAVASIHPVATYSQLLPKHFVKTDSPLDYFTPEFAHISYQPIRQKELAPLQAPVEQKNKVFGYQMPWYDYLQNHDQVHGLFRTMFNNFLIQRTFGSAPELGRDFLTINPDHLNNVFITDDNTDKFLGQIKFNMEAKREIPDGSVPKLN